jgi:hypothetical protein
VLEAENERQSLGEKVESLERKLQKKRLKFDAINQQNQEKIIMLEERLEENGGESENYKEATQNVPELIVWLLRW